MANESFFDNGNSDVKIDLARLVRRLTFSLGDLYVTEHSGVLYVGLPRKFGAYKVGVHCFPDKSEAQFNPINRGDADTVIKKLDELREGTSPTEIEQCVYLYNPNVLQI